MTDDKKREEEEQPCADCGEAGILDDVCRCEDGQDEEQTFDMKRTLLTLGIGAALLIAGIIVKSEAVKFVLCFASFALCGWPVLLRAWKDIRGGHMFDECFLMSIATVGAFAVGQYPEGAAIMLLFRIGEMLEDMAVGRSRKSIKALMDIRPDTANLAEGDSVREIPACDVKPGDEIIVKPGERIPLDGEIVSGEGSVDVSALTGESEPVSVSAGSEVMSGSVCMDGVIRIRVTTEFEDSTVSRILDITSEASAKKAHAARFITSFSRIYTPAVCAAALFLAVIPPIIGLESWRESVYNALVLLVISCPCALVLSVPLSYFGGIGGASKQGILIKSGESLESLAKIHTVAFDKTGTLTQGRLKVTGVIAEEGFTEDEVLALAGFAELASTHPIALAIREAAGLPDDMAPRGDYRESAGLGVIWRPANGSSVIVGKAELMKRNGIAFTGAEGAGTAAYIAVNGRLAGTVLISDPLKENAAAAISALKLAGTERTALLTGDRLQTAAKAASRLDIDCVFADLMPQDKADKMEMLKGSTPKGGTVAFVGDGINDAPVIALADVGIAMGGIGSDAAIESADAVIMTDDLMRVADAVRIAKRTRSIVRQNVIGALAAKAVIMVLGALGIAPLWLAVFADVGVALLAVINAARALRV